MCCLQLFGGKGGQLLSAANFLDVPTGKWRFPGEGEAERGAEREDGGTDIERAASKLLRAREIRCADKSSMRQIRFASGIRDRLGETEIDDLHMQLRRISSAARQHDIAGLQVP